MSGIDAPIIFDFGGAIDGFEPILFEFDCVVTNEETENKEEGEDD